jgi:hypothetical protein
MPPFTAETVMRPTPVSFVLALLAAVILLSSSVRPSLAAGDGLTGEQLFVLPPKGWTVAYHDAKGNVDVTELLPPGQTLKAWTQMLTVQLVSGHADKSPQDVLKAQVEVVKNACEDIGAGQVNLAVENGYETALRAIACPKTKQWGDGELSLYKAIVGKDRTYLVWRSWRGPAFDKANLPVPAETTQEWLAFMRQVVVCDSRDPRRACPEPQKREGQGQ